jgi:alpha-amylase/alpha-mannosidase (GH57 family)
MERYICIHGHFYQPPRENPWLEDIELQDSAYPFHDWNERVTAESYEPNTAARILDGEGRIRRIVNNLHRISFNFGPTLLSWMEKHNSDTYRAILEADRRTRAACGHGSAMSQAYNHIIMPLANSRDKRTQIIWGIRDFIHRFGREPQGMWLPETAVDLESLDIMAQQGITFTLLAPSQAGKVRPIDGDRWHPAEGEKIDPKTPYLCRLPSGASITIFFYDGPISRDVGFSDLLSNGERFAYRLLGAFSDSPQPQLVHIATDGETYGHHRRFGEMALAYCLHFVERNRLARLTHYSLYLAKHPPTHEVQILENTSWSCFHGVERWRSDCGCHTGNTQGWHQGWRAPLRESLDWLRDTLIPLFEENLGKLLPDPWQARDEYIEVILDRSAERVRAFLHRQAGRDPKTDEVRTILGLLEMQRQAMLMYTSCGWFFDEVSGIETTQILGYASRAIQLAEKTCGVSLEEEFLKLLQNVPSNIPKLANAARVYEVFVKPTRIDLTRVAAHVAIASLFGETAESLRIYCFSADNSAFQTISAGTMKLALGRTRIRSEVTWNEGDFAFAVLHFGGHHLTAGVGEYQGEDQFSAMAKEISAAFERSDISEVVRTMDRYFGSHTYTLWHLFKDEQRRIVRQILGQTLEDVEGIYRRIYESHLSLVRFLGDISMPVPPHLALPIEVVLNSELRTLLEGEQLDNERLRQIFEEAERTGVKLDQTTLGFLAGRYVNTRMQELAGAPDRLDLLEPLSELLDILKDLPQGMDLWKAQNTFFSLWGKMREKVAAAVESDEQAQLWLEHFRVLGKKLGLRLD